MMMRNSYPELDGLAPTMYSGDGLNTFPGKGTAPFVIYDLPDGQSLQFTISSEEEGVGGHFIKSVFRYPTPECRLKSCT